MGNFTKPAGYYLPPDEVEVKDMLSIHNIAPTETESMIAAIDAASHARDDADLGQAFIPAPQTPDPLKAQTLQTLIKGIDFAGLSGNTPKEKGLSFAALIKGQGGLDKMQKKQNQPGGLDNTLEELNQKIEALKHIKGGIKGGPTQKLLGISSSAPELDLPKLTTDQIEVLKALAQIKRIGKIQSKRKSKPRLDPQGRIQVSRLINDWDELPDAVDLQDIAIPYLGKLKLAEMDFTVNDMYTQNIVKQAVAMLIDRSGSMWYKWKQAYVRALLLHYFEAVVAGDTDLYISTFESEVDGFVKLSTQAECEDYYNQEIPTNGGMTEVGKCIIDVQKQLSEHKLGGYNIHIDAIPEVVIVNDGQDPVDPDMETNAPCHAIILEVDNENLKSVCDRSNGSYTKFDCEKWQERY